MLGGVSVPARPRVSVSLRSPRRAPRSSLIFTSLLALACACAGGEDGTSDAATSTAATSDGTGAGPGTDASAATSSATTTAMTTTATTSATDTGEPLPERFVVTADWLAGSLSVLDLELVLAGASYDEALHGVVALTHPPGPIEVALTPDGQTAVVAVGPGFFEGTIGATLGLQVPSGNTLALVDLVTLSESAALTPAHAPMGIAISPDGQLAYTANYGDADIVGTTMSIVDLAGQVIVEDVEVGARPEQVELSADGSLGVINLAGDGAIRVFETTDAAGTLSPPLAVSQDPSGVTFVGAGSGLVAVANSQGSPNYTLVDVSDPGAPVVLEQGPAPGGIPYPVTRLDGEQLALVSTTFAALLVSRVDAGASPSEITGSLELPGVNAFPLGLARADGPRALLGAMASGALYVLDLEAMELVHTIAWPDARGPSYVAVHGQS